MEVSRLTNHYNYRLADLILSYEGLFTVKQTIPETRIGGFNDADVYKAVEVLNKLGMLRKAGAAAYERIGLITRKPTPTLDCLVSYIGSLLEEARDCAVSCRHYSSAEKRKQIKKALEYLDEIESLTSPVRAEVAFTQQDPVTYSGAWECSGCGLLWEFYCNNTPSYHNMKYCPQCVGAIMAEYEWSHSSHAKVFDDEDEGE